VNSKSREAVAQESNRLFGRDLKEHLHETKQNGKEKIVNKINV
jgi:hypothetical protein